LGKLSDHTSNSLLGIFLGLVSLAILRITYPHTFSWHRAVKRLIRNPNDVRYFGPDEFAIAVLKRNKQVFDKLAEM
jgi:hypothetical protein